MQRAYKEPPSFCVSAGMKTCGLCMRISTRCPLPLSAHPVLSTWRCVHSSSTISRTLPIRYGVWPHLCVRAGTCWSRARSFSRSILDRNPRSPHSTKSWAGSESSCDGAEHRHIVRNYHGLCRAAGLIEVSQRGFFLAEATAAGTHLQGMHDAVAGIGAQIVQHSIASREEVDETLNRASPD